MSRATVLINGDGVKPIDRSPTIFLAKRMLKKCLVKLQHCSSVVRDFSKEIVKISHSSFLMSDKVKRSPLSRLGTLWLNWLIDAYLTRIFWSPDLVLRASEAIRHSND